MSAAMTHLHAGGRPGEERAFTPPPPPIRQMPQPRIAPEPRIEPERPVETTPSRDIRKEEQQREMAAAAEKEWAERPLSDEEKNLLTEPRPQSQSILQQQQQQGTQPGKEQQQPQRTDQGQTTQRRLSFDEARGRMTRERHDRAWWNERYNRIVRAGSGFYVFDEGYWFPAFGYDSEADIYAYEGPIYALADMTPDQEVAAVQERLEADGYYSGSITGVLDSVTQQAIAKFQADNGLLATGAIDQPTIEALGFA